MAASSFFSNLGDTLSKTVKEVSGRAGNAYETQKIKNKISGEEKQIQKIMADIGKIVYERYTEGVPVEEAQKTLCEQIDQRQEQIKNYNNICKRTVYYGKAQKNHGYAHRAFNACSHPRVMLQQHSRRVQGNDSSAGNLSNCGINRRVSR